jgi:hypothetical protein
MATVRSFSNAKGELRADESAGVITFGTQVSSDQHAARGSAIDQSVPC